MNVAQGSAATHTRCVSKNFAANFLKNLLVKEFQKSVGELTKLLPSVWCLLFGTQFYEYEFSAGSGVHGCLLVGELPLSSQLGLVVRNFVAVI